MTIRPAVIAGPSIEPISLVEAKLLCKVDGSTEDALFRIFIAAAREYFEDAAGYTIHEQTLEATFDRWPMYQGRFAQYGWYIELPRATPLLSVTSIIYTTSDGSSNTWDAGNYAVDKDSVPGRIQLPFDGTWPTAVLLSANGIRIRYVAGIATNSPVVEAPGAIKLPLLQLVAGMYANRESEAWEDNRATLIPAISMRYGVEAFIARVRDRVAPTSY